MDPTLPLSEFGTAANAWGPVHKGEHLGAWIFMGVAAIVLMLSVADEGPRSLVIVSTVLLGAGIAACLVPIRRALAIEPAATIKSE